MSALALAAERIVIRILQVDAENRLVHAEDKTKAPILAGFTATSTVFSVPQQGDLWTAVRYGSQWQIEDRLDDAASQVYLESLAPGDTVIAVPGSQHAQVNALAINGMYVGSTETDEFTTGGAQTTFALGGQPVAASTVMAFNNGLLIDPRTFTISANTITFGSAPAAGSLVVVFQRLGTVIYDAATVTGVARFPATTDDAATVTGIAVISSPFEGISFTYIDAGTAIAVAAPSQTDTAQYIESATVTATASISALEFRDFHDAATVTAIAIASATDTAQYVDAGSGAGIAVVSAADTAQFVDAGTAIGVANSSATDSKASADSATVIGVANIPFGYGLYGSGTYGNGTYGNPSWEYRTSDDSGTAIGHAVISATEGADFADASGTAIGTAAVSATDTAQYVEASTVAGIAVVSAVNNHGYVDAATAVGVAVPSANEFRTTSIWEPLVLGLPVPSVYTIALNSEDIENS